MPAKPAPTVPPVASGRPAPAARRAGPDATARAARGARVVLLTADAALAQRVGTLAAAAGTVLDRPVLPLPGGQVPPSWAAVPLVLLGADILDPTLADHPAGLRAVVPRGAVVVVAHAPAEISTWRHAVEVGADHVALLPEGEPWLLDRLLDAASGPSSGPVVGVLGGRGGAGASTLAVALALAAARRRLRTMLVDADPLGGGLDLLLGAEGAPGLRWADLVGVRGRLQPGQLSAGCVHVDGIGLVSWGAGSVSTRTARTAPTSGCPGPASSRPGGSVLAGPDADGVDRSRHGGPVASWSDVGRDESGWRPPPQGPTGENPFGENRFGGHVFGENPLGGDPFGGDPFGGDPFRESASDERPFGADLFGADLFGAGPFGRGALDGAPRRTSRVGENPFGGERPVPPAGLPGLGDDRLGSERAAGPEAVSAVLDAARREAQLTVVDLPRTVGGAQAAALAACSVVLLVVPAEVRAAAAAARIAVIAFEHAADLRLVVRGPAPTGLPAEAVADLLGLPLAAALPAEPGIAAILDRGEAAALRPRGALARFAGRFVGEVVGEGVGEVVGAATGTGVAR